MLDALADVVVKGVAELGLVGTWKWSEGDWGPKDGKMSGGRGMVEEIIKDGRGRTYKVEDWKWRVAWGGSVKFANVNANVAAEISKRSGTVLSLGVARGGRECALKERAKLSEEFEQESVCGAPVGSPVEGGKPKEEGGGRVGEG
jgi:hypothetical protein